MGFLNKVKTQIGGLVDKVYKFSNPKKEKENVDKGTQGNQTKDIYSQCKIVVYRYKQTALTASGSSNSALAETEVYDISTRVINATYQKSLSNAAGTFSFMVANNTGVKKFRDWKNFIKPGTWCIIYMSQNGDLDISQEVDIVNRTDPEYVRCIGYIERVAVKVDIDENGAPEIITEISGRDFGIIYEDTTIWHNLFRYEKTALEALKSSKLDVVGSTTIDKVIETVHNLFYAPAKITRSLTSGDDSITSLAKQWLLPPAMLNDLNIYFTGISYYGNIDQVLNIESTIANIPVSQPLDYLSGNAWQKLKELSVPQFHEFFAETTDDGKMQLTFRPIPWAINKAKYPKAGKFIKKFAELERVLVPKVDVIRFDLGEDNHNRKNHFLATVTTSLFKAEDNTSVLSATRFPFQITDSVKRHGFRPIHVDVNSLTMNTMKNDGKADRSLLTEFNEIIYDYWNNMIFFESGNLEKIGSNDVKIGKALQYDDDVIYAANRIFYIESYSDIYEVDENGVGVWTQSIDLTHGAEENDLDENKGFSRREKPFEDDGEFDGDIS